MSQSIAVFGGNGFLGRKICEVGVRMGWSVTSLSRSGNPPKPTSHSDHQWISSVNWQAADLFNPDTYKEHVANKNAVVHSVGILFENSDYKKAINSNFSFLNDFSRLASMLKGPNPLTKNHNSTYEAIQRDTAVMLADTYIENSKEVENPSYVYISAEMKPPIVPEGYLTTKREAEFELSCKPGLRSIFLRPGIMYDESAPLVEKRKLFSKFLSLGYSVKEGVLGDKIPVFNELIRPPVSTEQVAIMLYRKLEDPEANGVVSLDDIVDF
ncbi:hypothetical protein ACI3L0_003557 [Candidozyma auris]